MAIETYGLHMDGLVGDDDAKQLNIECFCFREGLTVEEGGLGKLNHFKNIVDLLWNNPKYESQVRFIWNDWSDLVFGELCVNRFTAISGSSSSGKSNMMALWVIVNYVADPTHTKAFVMSTTIKGARDRIWKYIIEYWKAIPNLPGKLVDSNGIIKGLSFDGITYGETSGIRLLASEKSKEKDALDSIIGVKAPNTEGPTGRKGLIIFGIDEMTGCSPSVYNGVKQNVSSNENFQLVGIANFADPFDSFGQLCKPKKGWSYVVDDTSIMSWETENGKCIILDAELSPRILNDQQELHWMLSREQIDDYIEQNGRNSLAFFRFIKARPSPKGAETSIYDSTEIIRGKAQENVVWGIERGVPVAFLDPAFTPGGDAIMATFGKFGVNVQGLQVLAISEQVSLKIDITDKDNEKSFQIVKMFRTECQRRGVAPRFAGYDDTGGGKPFGDIMRTQWSKEVLALDNGGSASSRPTSNTNKKPAKDTYANKCSEIWYGAKGFIRSGQIRGMSDDLAKELCTRQSAKTLRGEEGRKLKVESKREYKQREEGSPDKSDSFLGMLELCRLRLGFKCAEKPATTISMNGTDETSSGLSAVEEMIQARHRNIAANPTRKKVLTIKRLDYHS